mgnify:CR=1 FL=1
MLNRLNALWRRQQKYVNREKEPVEQLEELHKRFNAFVLRTTLLNFPPQGHGGGRSMISFSASALANNEFLVRYQDQSNGDTTTETYFNRIIIPFNATLKNMYVGLTTAPGAGTSRTFTVRRNAVNQSLLVTISEAATTGNDVTNTVAVTAGQEITVQGTLAGAPAASRAVADMEVAS